MISIYKLRDVLLKVRGVKGRHAAESIVFKYAPRLADIPAEKYHEVYADCQMALCEIEREDDGRWIGEIPHIPGVIAYGATVEEARAKAIALALRVIEDQVEVRGTVEVRLSLAQLDRIVKALVTSAYGDPGDSALFTLLRKAKSVALGEIGPKPDHLMQSDRGGAD